MTINNKSERNYRGKCLGWPVTSYGGGRGFDSHRGQKKFFFTSCGSLISFTRANGQWFFHGFHIAL